MTIKALLETMNPHADVTIISSYDDFPVASDTAYGLWKNTRFMLEFGGKHVLEIHASAEESFYLVIPYFVMRQEDDDGI